MRQFFFIFSLFIFVTCSSSEPSQPQLVEPAPKKEVSQKSELQPSAIETQVDKQALCLEALKKWDLGSQVKISSDKRVEFVFSESQVFTETEFSKNLLKFSDEIFGQYGCDYEQVTFQSFSSEGPLWLARLARENYFLFRKSQISEPEFTRRLEIVQKATLASLKAKLKKARQFKKQDEALIAVNAWLENDPENLDAQVIRANIFLDQKDFYQAVSVYEKVLQSDSKNLTARFNLAVTKKKLGQIEAAVLLFDSLEQDIKSSQELDKSLWGLHRVDAYLSLKNIQMAEAALQKITLQKIGDVDLFRIVILREQKKFSEAKEVLENYLKAYPEESLALYNLALTFLDLKNTDEAVKTFLRLKLADADVAKELEFLPLFAQSKEPEVLQDEETPSEANPDPDLDEEELVQDKKVDVPYKPPSLEVLEKEQESWEGYLPGKKTGQPEEADGEDSEIKFDYTTLPFIPFKRPELPPASDPMV